MTWELVTNAVVLFDPLNCTVAPFTKPTPFTVRVKAAEPAVTPGGESEVTVGGAPLIVNNAALDVMP